MRGALPFASALAVAGSVWSCGDPVLLVAPPTFPQSIQTAVIALEGVDWMELVVVEAPFEDLATQLAPRSLGEVRIWALAYDAPISALPFDLGPLSPAVAEPSRALPPPDRVLVSYVLGRRVDPWTPADEMSDALRALRIAGMAEEDPCIEWVETVHPVVPTSDAGFAVAVDDTSALVGTEDGRFFWVGASGITQLEHVPTTTPHDAAYVAPDGEIWLVGASGALSRGRPHLGETPQEVTRNPAMGRLRWIDGPPAGEAFELFAVSNTGTVARFEGAAWTAVKNGGEPLGWERGVAWVGPAEAVIGGTRPGLARYVDGAVRDETPPGLAPVTSVANLPGLGLYAGTKDGTVLRRQSSGWTRMESPFALPVAALAPTPRGFVAAGGGGAFAEYIGGYGFCPIHIVSSGIVKHAAVLRDAIVLFGDRPSSASGNSIIVLTPLRR